MIPKRRIIFPHPTMYHLSHNSMLTGVISRKKKLLYPDQSDLDIENISLSLLLQSPQDLHISLKILLPTDSITPSQYDSTKAKKKHTTYFHYLRSRQSRNTLQQENTRWTPQQLHYLHSFNQKKTLLLHNPHKNNRVGGKKPGL